MSARYRLVFRGQFLPGMDRADVIGNLATLFKTSPERIEALLASPPAVIKAEVDLDTGHRYQDVLAEAGLIIQLEALNEDGTPATAPPATTGGWDGVERRMGERRHQRDRRSNVRGSAIQPDRRQNDRRKPKPA